MDKEEDGLPVGIETRGGFIQYDVNDVDEAIALGERFKARGRYRYFRGQRDANWKVQSSLARHDEDGRKREIEKFSAFYGWVKDSPELVPYLSDDDMIIATAQHHGICATNFIDFTTEPAVAAWFATDGAIPGDNGAILMVDEEAEGLLTALTKSVAHFLHPDVANLWRLQAQHGLFLETRTDIERIWPLDRIVFRQIGGSPRIERRRIYPDRRSHLEQMIDQHLVLKAREEKMREFLENTPFYQLNMGAVPDLTPPDLAATEFPEKLQRSPDERWQLLDIESDPPILSQEALEGGGELLEQVVQARRVSLDLAVIEPDPLRRNGTIQPIFDLLWSGMRPLPYDVSQLAHALSALVRFNRVFGDFPLSSGRSPMDGAPELLHDPIEIEMGIVGGGSTRAGVTASRLRLALTAPARELLGLSGESDGKAILDALHPYYGKTLRFFDKQALVELFADEVVPWQVATRRNPVAFWPEHVASLGRP